MGPFRADWLKLMFFSLSFLSPSFSVSFLLFLFFFLCLRVDFLPRDFLFLLPPDYGLAVFSIVFRKSSPGEMSLKYDALSHSSPPFHILK